MNLAEKLTDLSNRLEAASISLKKAVDELARIAGELETVEQEAACVRLDAIYPEGHP